jgi:choline kinase
MAPFEVVILAAGLGTRLGQPFPKPLTPLASGESILDRQVDRLRHHFGSDLRVTVVVGFKLDLVLEACPDVGFVYNERYDATNTAKSLLKALRLTGDTPVLWLNGDVVFHEAVLGPVGEAIASGGSLVCVNTASVAEEEVKYTTDDAGFIDLLSKTVQDARGEALGINFVAASDKAALIHWLAECGDQDYFERGIEQAIAHGGLRVRPLDISSFPCVEVDFAADLDRANAFLESDAPS